MTQNALIKSEQIAIEDVKTLINIVAALRTDVFKDGVDYGVIPGTGDKPVLLLPGMEKLMRALRLRAEYVLKTSVEDFDKPLFFYRYECRLIDYETGACVATAIGSANSQESKWRWRAQDRVCPNCHNAAIIKGKQEYGGGWLCFAKKGGCGAKFAENDPAITGQQVGRVENPDIFDQINTIDKIAQKRALGSAIKGAANVSMFFTVDLEDFQPFEIASGAPMVIVQPADPDWWAELLKLADEKLGFAETSVRDALRYAAGWQKDKRLAVAAVIAAHCGYDAKCTEEYTVANGYQVETYDSAMMVIRQHEQAA